jgi:concentrative nucleoside transporter, CNT family
VALLQQALGLVGLVGLCVALSEDCRAIPWRTVLSALALGLVLAGLFVGVPQLSRLLSALNGAVDALEAATRAGTSLVFGFLGGGALPYAESRPGASFVLAFRALPLLLVVSALSALLFHVGVLPLVVRGFARVLSRTLGIGGAVGVSAAANVFVGMVEAPLVVKPYLARLSRGELFIVMTCGMATIAGSVLVLYASIVGPVVPDALGHLLIASFVSTPVAIAVSSMLVPCEVGDAEELTLAPEDPSALAALTRGTLEGLSLWLNVMAMLIVFVALVSLANAVLAVLPSVYGAPLSLERLLGWLFSPLAFLIGVPLDEAPQVGALLGKKTVLNELVAYLDLPAAAAAGLSERSRLLAIYALCGFANFGSVGIMLGGLSGLLPEARRAELASLGLKSVLSGLFATCITAALIGLFV